MASLHDVDEGVWIRGSFTDPSTGQFADPSEVRVRYKAPSAPVYVEMTYGVDPEVVKDSPGHYSVLLIASEAGLWQYRWEGDNAAPAITESSFVVRRTVLA